MNAALEQARTLFFQGNAHFEAGRLNEAAGAYRQALAVLRPGQFGAVCHGGLDNGAMAG